MKVNIESSIKISYVILEDGLN